MFVWMCEFMCVWVRAVEFVVHRIANIHVCVRICSAIYRHTLRAGHGLNIRSVIKSFVDRVLNIFCARAVDNEGGWEKETENTVGWNKTTTQFPYTMQTYSLCSILDKPEKMRVLAGKCVSTKLCVCVCVFALAVLYDITLHTRIHI